MMTNSRVLARQVFEYTSKTEWDALISLFSRDVQFQFLPESLHLRVLDREGALGMIRGFDAFVKTTLQFSDIDIIESVDGSRVVAHVKIDNTFSPDGLKAFDIETIYMFSFVEEDGENKISKMQIFSDSAVLKEYYAYVASVDQAILKVVPLSV